MIIPIFILFVLASVVWLIVGLQSRNEIAIIVLNLFWWLGSFVSAYFTMLAWQEKGYSENWAMIGFIFYSIPYIVVTSIMIVTELFFIRKWQGGKTKIIRVTSVSMLFFLIFQLIIGFLSG